LDDLLALAKTDRDAVDAALAAVDHLAGTKKAKIRRPDGPTPPQV
jgi:hypothetical protein